MYTFRPARAAGAAMVVILVCAATVGAATIELSLQYVTSWDSTFTSNLGPLLSAGPPIPAGTVAPTDYHEFDVYMELSGLLPSEHFKAVNFDVLLAAGLVPGNFGGNTSWLGNNPVVDPLGPSPPSAEPLFTTSADTVAVNDLNSIVVIGNSYPYVDEGKPGESGPYKLGTFWIHSDGSTSSSVQLAPHGGTPWSSTILVPFGAGAGESGGSGSGEEEVINPHDASTFTGGTFTINYVPEPTGLALAGMALICLLALAGRHSGTHSHPGLGR